MKRKSEAPKDTANVEFGIEFGDMNAAKNYDFAFMNENKRRKNKQK